ncbi:response regulator [Candidatus Pyrohabitans sp.]
MARILIADDELITLRGLERVLSREGHQVITAENGEEALRLLKENRVDILITDIKLPGVDGSKLLEWVKQNLPDTKVIMITGYSSIKGAVEAMKHGASDYIAKPFSFDEMKASIKAVLEEQKVADNIPTGGLSRTEFELVIRALNHPIRREIIRLLRSSPSNFTGIWRKIGVKDPTIVSFHLRNLKATGMVDQRKDKVYLLTLLGRKAASFMDMVKVEEHIEGI